MSVENSPEMYGAELTDAMENLSAHVSDPDKPMD